VRLILDPPGRPAALFSVGTLLVLPAFFLASMPGSRARFHDRDHVHDRLLSAAAASEHCVSYDPSSPSRRAPRPSQEEWDSLYARLKTLLDSRGKSDAFGHGDFWIVDDNWGTPQHKVCIFQLGFLRPDLVREVQRLLQPSPRPGFSR
jgi:hypothetical protein